ncbi:MAG: hypothetical protein A3B91_04655 [Candidatus Yanofskybacteria bacterium RIFCSPHIGHO2_02_FULL_41_29]|uniref:Glycosyltransferase RgtA/B/C/D-like domain-containing protein n=1 Tax=Candidatus Yanofskybacteria bacterium RIFCSPHIGHO2_01_FULL_41_53 TaxID=1802663 RepID=A0A1F8EHF5_9BACT|nr:MAG: hypothetical protein A2650_04440 [Candidatus Yanofskybacteria bacterium RIFCSPHIGHO2_01_FULL_41_53]OGN11487.1 MAG: hypothetical protein A3B91_04655 [Candidatus Yanofskybacteria bacterium RIFCSPHIGHO2_02_FULL_41_29]OGN22597.1 MAG: hypothetical protein A2916_03050 [Candidatus Yanofskybacteria bacterium RIFCSPLOWO2_01_FULL_41_67]OGN29756.1 MAG: hypothetical protein A3H54_04220 [Candidatus Yanofskybacteria bacterium RIFCSPLOWO2_02_FULL_41_13]OGN35624.1 MAG: hypothetical protein A3F98_02355 
MIGSSKKELFIFIAIILIAVFFRFYQLDITPPGLWPDEAANGVDALKALDDNKFKLFYPDNNGREGLFINIQAVSMWLFGAEPWSLRVVSVVMGTITIIGLYFLTRYIFGWQLAAIAGFFLAISFWHVNFSRIGFRAIMLPLIIVWAFYFLWKGLRKGDFKHFLIAGIIGGIGFYTYFSYRIVPLIALVLFWNYWSYLKKDFSHGKYEHARNQLLRGFALMMLTVIAIVLPLLIYFYSHPEDFLKREGRPISVFAQEEPFKELGLSIVKTLGMFNFSGDYNQRHNIPGWPQLSIPMGILFLVGFLRELIHWLKRKHGHFSPAHTFLFSWFFIMLIPGFLSTEAPHALRTIGVVPVVMIFAAKGFLWFVNLIIRLHRTTDPHIYADKIIYKKELKLIIMTTVLIFMTSLAFLEYFRYFKVWAVMPSLEDAFSQKLVNIADYLNKRVKTDHTPIYILVNEGDVLVDGVPNNAQTIKFLSRTHNYECSNQKNVFYLRSDQIANMVFHQKYIIIPLADNDNLRNELLRRFGLSPEKQDSFVTYVK